MRPHHVISLALLIVAPAAIAGERQFEFTESPAYGIEFVNGREVALADGKTALVAVAYFPVDRSHAWIGLNIQNISSEAFVVRESSLTAGTTSEELEVPTYAELMKKQKHSEFWQNFAAGMAAGAKNVGASNAGRTYQSGTYSSTTQASAYGSDGYAYGTANTTGHYSGTTYDPGAASAAQARASDENARMMERVKSSQAAQRSSLGSRILQANTLAPGESVSGQLQVELPAKSRKNGEDLQLTLRVGKDEFNFILHERFD